MPPITRTDFPYPLRTVDGEVDVVVDSMLATTLDVTGATNVGDLFVSGTTTIVGGIVNVTNVDALTLDVSGLTVLEGLATLNGGLNTTSINCTNITSTGLLNGTNVTLSSLTPNQTVATNALKQLISVPSTGTGNNVLQNSPTLITPNIGAASGTSLSLGTPLGTASGGTGTTLSTGSGANVLQTSPTLITPNIGVASGTSLSLGTPLGTASGGTGTTLSTGSGANVLQTSPTLITPNIGVASGSSLNAGQLVANQFTGNSFLVQSNTASSSVTTGAAVITGGLGIGNNIIAGGVIETSSNIIAGGGLNGNTVFASSTVNATSPTTGAIRTDGGLSTARDFYVGGNSFITGSVTAASFSGGGIINPANIFSITNTSDAVNPTSGSIQTLGGLGVVKNIVAGGVIQSEISQNATSTSTGALRALNGGISCAQDIRAGGNVHANQLFINTLILNSVTMNFNSGIFVPALSSPTGNPGFPITYVAQIGTYQNCGNMTFFQLRVVTFSDPFPPGFPPNSHVRIDNIPGTYVEGQARIEFGNASTTLWFYEGGDYGSYPIFIEFDSVFGWLCYVYDNLNSSGGNMRRKVYFSNPTEGFVISLSGVALRVSV